MTATRLVLATAAMLVVGCGSIAQLGVRTYTAKTGESVTAGLVEPKAELACRKVTELRHDWGWRGTSDRQAGILRLTAEAVDAAPAHGANYVHVMPPSEKSVMGFNVNTFSDAGAVYYRCGDVGKVAALPAR